MKFGDLDSPIKIDKTQAVVYDSGELAAAATSITISGLDGDVDEEYELIVREVSGGTPATLFLSFNSDTDADNYGTQCVYGENSTAGASRSTGSPTGWQIGSLNTNGYLCFSQTKIKAKSGQVRTGITKFAYDINGTSIIGIYLRGQSWNNSVDNINSLVLTHASASGIGIGSRVILLKKVNATSGTKTGELDILGSVYGTWQEVYSTTLEAPISNADIDDEDMADITDWADTDGAGTGAASSQVTFDSKSCMKLDSGSGTGGTNYARRGQDLGTFGARTVFSFTTYCDAIGTLAANDVLNFGAYNGTTLFLATFASDGLTIYNGSAEIEIGTNIVVQDTWQEWTFDVDWTAKTVDVYLNNALVQVDADCSYDTAGTNGQVYIYQNGATTANRISYINWFKAGTDLVALSSGATRGSQTSLTVSGLTGNTDVLYRVRARIVNGYNGAASYLIRPNNISSADNSGYQSLEGSDATVSATRGTLTGLILSANTALNQLTMSEVILYAKSGFVRTAITERARDISTTTVATVSLIGQALNNTSDEITSLVFFASQTGGYGIGSSFVVERLNL